jgi:hypothetical protein
MRVKSKNEERLHRVGYEIEDVNKFCYLWCIVYQDGGANKDVTTRINKAKRAFVQRWPIWTSHQIHKGTKLRIFKSNATSVSLYVCETW